MIHAKMILLDQVTEEEWRKYAPVNKAITGLGNSLSSHQRQAIIWTNDH